MDENNFSVENPQIEELQDQETVNERNLILHNDDYHTFDFVIDSLVEICEHEVHQAEQCTYIIHYKGKCDVKSGTYIYLKPMKDELINRGLNASID